jgi:hypothetical protein
VRGSTATARQDRRERLGVINAMTAEHEQGKNHVVIAIEDHSCACFDLSSSGEIFQVGNQELIRRFGEVFFYSSTRQQQVIDALPLEMRCRTVDGQEYRAGEVAARSATLDAS